MHLLNTVTDVKKEGEKSKEQLNVLEQPCFTYFLYTSKRMVANCSSDYRVSVAENLVRFPLKSVAKWVKIIKIVMHMA